MTCKECGPQVDQVFFRWFLKETQLVPFSFIDLEDTQVINELELEIFSRALFRHNVMVIIILATFFALQGTVKMP